MEGGRGERRVRGREGVDEGEGGRDGVGGEREGGLDGG